MEATVHTIEVNGNTYKHFDKKTISVVLVSKFEILFGTKDCCFGNLITLHQSKEGINVHSVISAPTNVQAMLPIRFKTTDALVKTGFISESLVLVAGQGCAGTGIWIIDSLYSGSPVKVMSDEEFRSLGICGVIPYKTRLIVDEEGCVFFDYTPANRSSFVSWEDNVKSVDLTDRLKPLGFDPEKTLDNIRRWKRIQ